MTQVISSEQARKITGGRTPLVPVEYEDAIRGLSACLNLDEARYWDNQADALAAWAKIYRSDDAGRKARQLKLHAYRRMGELARALRPYTPPKKGQVSALGPRSLLLESGLTGLQADSAVAMARMPQKKFDDEIARPRPRSPTNPHMRSNGTPEWVQTRNFISCLNACFSKWHPADMAKAMQPPEIVSAKKSVRELSDWLDEFDRYLGEHR